MEGENGHMAILTGTCGDALVALDTECQRDTPISSLRDLLGAVWDDARETEDGLDTFGRFLG